MDFNIPGVGAFTINTVILDLNGTMALDGKVIEGVPERLDRLRQKGYELHLFTGDTNGTAVQIAGEHQLTLHKTPDAAAKAAEAVKLNAPTCAALGNGAIDLNLFHRVQLAIGVQGPEGIFPATFMASDVVVTNINDGLDLLLNPNRIVATLRR